MCGICFKMLSAVSIKPRNLKLHLERSPADLVNTPRVFIFLEHVKQQNFSLFKYSTLHAITSHSLNTSTFTQNNPVQDAPQNSMH